MQALIQRVSHANVMVDDRVVGEIGKGLLVLLGVEKQDNAQTLDKLLNKVLSYRVFPDAQGKMNLSLKDIGGELLVVSQFTLAADTSKGLRPSFSSAADPAQAEALYNQFLEQAEQIVRVASGEFAADMQVSLCNDGPVTFLLSA